MIPYADFLYFAVALYVVVPALVLGTLGRLMRTWLLLATLVMLVVQYPGEEGVWPGVTLPGILLVVGYAVYQYGVARAYLLASADTTARWPAYAAVLASLLPLLVAKLVPALSPNSTVGFIGISYLTFRSLDVVFCIKDGVVKALPPITYLAFLLFFPTISSGPIDRYRRFSLDWKHVRTRAEFVHDLDGGVHRLFTGFLYKFIVAALIKRYWLDPASSGADLLSIGSYMYAYTLYIFFDFAGYSAFAIGLSYLFGIHTPENFRRPFLARSIRDFWDRWHISLSYWFRDHVYTRFVFAATKGHWFASKYTASHLGFLLTMGLMGLWHGTELHFVAYGLYHAGLLIAQDVLSRLNARRRFWGEGPLWHVASIVVTFNLVSFGLLIFSGRLG